MHVRGSTCISCHTSLHPQATIFQLDCREQHHLCPNCFSEVMALKSCNYYFSCPCDINVKLNSWKTISGQVHQQHQRHPASSSQLQSRSFKLQQPDRNKHPIQYHYHLFTSQPNNPLLRETSYLSFSSVDEKKGFFHTTTEILGNNKADEQSKTEKNKLENIFAMFHPLLVAASKKMYSFSQPLFGCANQESDSGAEQSNTIYDFAKNDKTLLYRCLFALTTGDVLYNQNEEEVDDEVVPTRKLQNISSRVFTCADIIRNTKSGSKSSFRNHVGNLLAVHGVSQAVYDILNGPIGIATRRECVRKNVKAETREKLKAGISLAGRYYDLLLILYDNIGFKRRGGGKKMKGVGYDQYTAVTIHRIAKEKLQEWGIYKKRDSDDGE